MIRAESEIKLVRVNSGEQGYNTATIFLYKRSAESVTIDWTNDLVYNFANKALTSLPDGWFDSIPSGSNPLYVTSSVAYSNTATDTIPYTDWKTPSMMAESGETGISVISVTRYYQLSQTQPELPDPPVSPPGGDWQPTEPPYSSGNTSLWYVDVSVFSDDSVQYSDIGRAYSYQVVSDTRALAQTINENYIRWDASHNRLINKDAEDVIEKYTSAYMKFTQTTGDDEDPLLLLGDPSTGFVTAISNRGMRFYQNTPIDVDEEGTIDIEDTVRYDMEQPTSKLAIAYFDDNQMKINRGVVVDRLQVGEFRWDSGSDGSLTFRWVGGN